MKTVYLSDKEVTEHLFPFTQTRSAADLRIGILTIRQKWDLLLQQPVQLWEDTPTAPPADAILFAANIVPSVAFIEGVIKNSDDPSFQPDYSAVQLLQYPWHLFQWNDWAIREDFKLLTRGRHSEPIPESVQVINST